MAKVDTVDWKAFWLRDLFEVLLAKGDIQPKQISDGDIPLVSAGNEDNGIVAMIDAAGDGVSKMFPAGCISVSMFGRVFYQTEAFYAVSHGRVNVLKPMRQFSYEQGLFITSCLNRAFAHKFDYATMCTQKKLMSEMISLPATPDGQPDWAYMEQYMRQIMDKEDTFAQHLASLTDEAAGEGYVVDTSSWKAFKVGQLFETHMVGKKMCVPTGGMITQQALNDGNTPRITVSGIDNGVIGEFADVNSPNYRVYENFISVSFLGTVFYQEQRTSVDMKVHVLKCAELNRLRGLFLVSVIRASLMNCSYAQQISSSILPNLELTLPTTVDGSPDWAYMEEYMRQIMAREQIFADHLASFA